MHLYLSLPVPGDALAGGQSFTDQKNALIQCYFSRFSEIEQIAVLSFIILHYRINVLDEPQYAHETAAERKSRVLAPQIDFVIKPVRTPVMFRPREGANILAC